MTAQLSFRQLLVMRVIADYIERFGMPPRQVDLFDRTNTFVHTSTEGQSVNRHGRPIKEGLINRYLVENDIPPFNSELFTGNPQLGNAIKDLRELGMLVPYEEIRTPYQLTKAGYDVLDDIGSDWRKWPMKYPLGKKRG